MVLLCTLLLQTWNNADAKFKSVDLCNITDQFVAKSSTSEPGSMHTAAGQRLHTHTRTQAACFRTGSSVKPAKHQLEAQIAQRHVQSHAAGSTEHHRQTQGRARRTKTTGCKGTGAEYSGAAHKGGRSEVSCIQTHAHTRMQTLRVHALHNFVTKLHPTRNWIHAQSVNKDICSRLKTHRCRQEKSVALLEE